MTEETTPSPRPLQRSLFTPLRATELRLPTFLSRLIFAGTGGLPESDRRSLAVANVTGYLGAISSASFAISFSLVNFEMLKAAVIGNIFSAVATALTPFTHRFGRTAGVYYLAAVFYLSLFFFVSELGRDAGIQLNYIAASAIVIVIFGVKRIAEASVVVAVGFFLHLAAWFIYPSGNAWGAVSPLLTMQLYTQSTATIMIILGFVVWYILSLLETAQERSQTLLFNMMPAAIAQRLIDAPQRRVAERHADTTVMFADLCGFTRLMATLDAGAVVDLLNDIFSELDALTEHYKVEKIKTIGDAYMVCAGVPVARADHAEAVAALALDIVAVIDEFAAAHKLPLKIRIG
ncbi:MAG: adenylate/guanylate cyclase domain-containing protein, partial [Pseudomonadota bacterium]